MIKIFLYFKNYLKIIMIGCMYHRSAMSISKDEYFITPDTYTNISRHSLVGITLAYKM